MSGGLPRQTLEAAAALARCEHAIALTGAGISVESGIPDFRSPGGLWERFDPLEYASIDTFLEHPERSWELFVEVEQILAAARPNPAHRALAELEELGVLRSVITQNIDGLHQRAGSQVVREFHGTHAHLHCVECGRHYGSDYTVEEIPPRCGCGAPLKPAVVLFGEAIPEQVAADSAEDARRCDGILVVGTSAEVYPAAAIPRQVAQRGMPVIVVDLIETALTREYPDLFVHGSAGEVLPALVGRVAELRDDPIEHARSLVPSGVSS